MPNDARGVTRAGDENVSRGIQGQTRDRIGVMNDRCDHFGLQQRIDAQRPIPMASAEDEFRIVRHGE